ncbi:SMI1/KNR4 family protein [Mucilaginibacter ginkgonis]|uniref:SMI1/KNR4 family protein n=1 Tax=Mucilaginibacter ginkgonis TaxID=2682091 RepID=A0A6I4IMT4_9SPHI|nr:SMI1/KNR4 family protein [Mucilaginibacter ginkgonis]QQL50996.1 SMI1/KNR4 family protein [Mucilaginibacter ginkgonis]
MKTWIKEAVLKWESSETKLNPPASLAQLAEVERKLQFTFPEDFRQLYLTANGFEGLDWQEHMFSFWSLGRIIDELEDIQNKDIIGFCDFLLNSHIIAFSRTRLGIFKHYEFKGTEVTDYLTDTFENAVKMINAGSDEIY